MGSTTITASNQDISAALGALETLVKERGFPDTATVMCVGKTMRRLRVVRDETAEQTQILINAHAKRDEEGKILQGADPRGVDLEDPRAFIVEANKLGKEKQEVEIWPISAQKLAVQRKNTKCTRCKQLIGMPTPEGYAVLVDLGILLEAKKDSGDAEDDAE